MYPTCEAQSNQSHDVIGGIILNVQDIRFEKGQSIGRWTLVKNIGGGGNGTVWRARSGNEIVAIKLLKSCFDERHEPFRRFHDEFKLMQKLQGRSGVMPVLDGEMQRQSGKSSPCWFAMPLAVSLNKQLGSDSSLREVVQAVSSYASTLEMLHAESISHRDLKPDNLFWLNGEWVIGDFGLAAFPEQEAHDTPLQRRFGPLFYQAPEMLNHARESAGSPADVYALAKVLWRLGTGLN